VRLPRLVHRRGPLIAAIIALAVAIPGPALGASGAGGNTAHRDGWLTPQAPKIQSSGVIDDVEFHALVSSGEEAFGTLFEGIPDGVGVVPSAAPLGFVDIYVSHEQSRVPFPLVNGAADFQDSSVSRVRVDLSTWEVIDMDVALSPDEGFIRFCSAFMAGPEHGFPHYTFMVNEESNDPLDVPAGAAYGPDPAYGGANIRQAGYSVYLDTATGKVGVVAGAGRHNHENTVVVPGAWRGIFTVSGDDTFTTPSTEERPNFSQLYGFSSKNWRAFQKDEGTMWAFRVTGTQDGPVDAGDPANGANDYLDISVGDVFSGEFIEVPQEVARGTTAALPQDALEDWSNEENIFQFVRVEDIAYDPDDPRVLYFADTGNTRITPSTATGRLWRPGTARPTSVNSNGRIFKLVLDEDDPTIVEELSIVLDAGSIGMRSPDNLDVGRHSLMVQEDTSSFSKIWMYDLDAAAPTWTHVATATQAPAETSGIVDVSRWFGDGWWALTIQSHVNLPGAVPGVVYEGPGPANGAVHTVRREDGQLVLMHVPGS
jgi:hypothetical protein